MFLRQSTASQEILLGRFVDSTDGNTEETALTIANTDIKVFKGGATTLADKNSGGATHIANGMYSAVLDATDTNTVGELEVHVHVSGALSVVRRYYVLEEAIYDALFAASANGFAGAAGASTVTFSNTSIATATNVTTVNGLAANVITAAATAADFGTEIGTAVWASATRELTALDEDNTTIDLNGTTIGTVTNLTNLPTIPANWLTAAGTAADFSTEVAGVVADAVWDEDATGHQTGGTFGQAIGDPGADTNTIFKAVVTDATGATVGVDVAAVLDDTGTAGVVVASLANNSVTAAALAADAGTEIGTAVWASGTRTLTAGTNIDGSTFTAIPWNASWDAEVQSEVDDALVAQRLDELLNADSDIDGAAPPTVGSVFHELMSKTAGSFTFDQTTDSLEAVRDKAADIEADTADIQFRLPAALTGNGRMDSDANVTAINGVNVTSFVIKANVTQINSDATAAANAEAFFDGTGYAGTGNVIPTVTTVTNTVDANVTQISGDSTAADNLEAACDGSGFNLGGGSIVAASVGGVTFTSALTEGYRSAGATGSVRDLLYEIIAHLGESAISGTTKTLKKLDGSTTAKTYTLDSDTTPTAITETT